MDPIGPGTLLAGRYRLREQVQADEVTALWLAQDTTLERAVAVRVIEATHARVQETLDAARRAALVDDHRLQRILGVGTEAGSGFVVLEWVDGDDVGTLAGSVGEEEAVRLVTEAAEALRAAARRELHHSRLGPRNLLRDVGGKVRLTGTAIDVAASGQPSPTAAARPEARDVRDLSAVLYALVTGHWPFGAVEGMPAAPTERGRPVHAARLRGEVSEPLAGLLAETLSGYGPDSLDALVERLHEASAALSGAGRTPGGGGRGDGDGAVRASLPAGAGVAARTAGRDQRQVDQEDTSDGGPAGTDELVDTDVLPVVRTGAGAAAAAGGTSAAAGTGTPRMDATVAAAGSAAAGAAATGAAAAASTRTDRAAATNDALSAPATAARAGAAPPPDARLTPARTADPPAPAAAASRAPLSAWTDDDGWDLLPGGDQEQGYGDTQQPWDDEGHDAQAWEQQPWDDEDWEDPAGQGRAAADPRGAAVVLPGGSRRPTTAPAPGGRRRPAGAGTGVLVSLVMLAVVVASAVWALDRFQDTPVAAPAVPSASAAPSVAPSTAPLAPEPSPEPTVAELQLVLPSGVQALDPQGDGEENDQDAPRAIDGDPETSWSTQAYNSQDFGGLKTGLGLALDLGEPREVTSVLIAAPGDGGEIELRTSDSPGFDGSTVVATAETGDSLELVLEAPVTTQFLLVWITSLPENDDDWRAVVSEVQVQVR